MSNQAQLEFESEIDDLFSKLLDGELAGQEEQQLREHLQSDHDVRRQYATLLHLHAMLHWQQSEAFTEFDLTAIETAPNIQVDTENYSRPATGRHYLTHPTVVSFALSALFITTIVLSMAFWKVPALRPQPASPVAQTSDYVARIVSTYQAAWSERSEVPPNEKFDLRKGEQIDLTAGLAELRFDDGTKVILQSPCSLIPLTDSKLRLVDGSVNVRVPGPATGFIVQTLLADFVDLGTEFGVGVARSGEISSQIFEGRVEVTLPTDDEPFVLTEGQAIRLDGVNEPVVSSTQQADAFVRAMPRPRPVPPRPVQAEMFDGSGDCQLVGKATIRDGLLHLPDGDSYAEILDAEQTPPLSNAYTITLRFKVDEIRAQNILVRTNAAGPLADFSHQLFMRNDGLLVHYTHDGQLRHVTNTEPLQAGRWYHVAIAAEAGGPMQLFIDGAKAAEWSNPLNQLWASGDRFIVGGNAANATSHDRTELPGIQGAVSQIQVFPRLLRHSEWLAVCNEIQQ